MIELPKSVHDRLRAAAASRAASDQAHPDADLLTAFAEQALSAAERDRVLDHLACCGDCREAVVLALSAADVVAAPIAAAAEAVRATPAPANAERHSPTAPNFIWTRFSWAGLRWAALAAGVAVVATALLFGPGKLNQATRPSANWQVATNVPPASEPRIASPILSSPSGQSAASANAEEARPKPELLSSKKLKAGRPVTPSHQAESGILLADNRKNSAQADKLAAAPPAGASAFDAPSSRGVTETVEVEVTGSSTAISTESPTGNGVMARNETIAVEKAQPTVQTEASQLQDTVSSTTAQLPVQGRNVMSMAKLAPSASRPSARNVTWTITAGVLRRSVDSGESWQNALRADHPLLCYAIRGEDVWAGGQAGTLFHSADSGATWTQVQPSIKAQQLRSDIAHIDVRGDDVRGPAEIVVSTGNNEIWSSADGGKTWGKK